MEDLGDELLVNAEPCLWWGIIKERCGKPQQASRGRSMRKQRCASDMRSWGINAGKIKTPGNAQVHHTAFIQSRPAARALSSKMLAFQSGKCARSTKGSKLDGMTAQSGPAAKCAVQTSSVRSTVRDVVVLRTARVD